MPSFRLLSRILTGAALVAVMAACSGNNQAGTSNSAPSGSAIKIGIDLPVSGADASIGIPTQNGAVLAIEQAEKKGLPAGLHLSADALDDAVQGVHSPQQGAANTKNFISDANVLAMIGPFNSNVAKAEIPLTNGAGLVQISPSNTNDGLTKGPDAATLRRTNPSVNSYFRVCAIDSRQGAAGAQFAKSLGFKKAYLLDDNETYGLGLANVFEADFKSGGGTVIGHDHITKNQVDFKALLTKIAGTHPDVVFFGGTSSNGGGQIRKQMSDAGMGAVAYMGGDGISDQEFITSAGATANGSYYTLAAPNTQKLPSAQQFIKDYEARWHTPVGPYSASAYAAAQIEIAAILKAIKDNGNKMPTRDQVLKNVAATTSFASPIGPIGFDKDGDLTSPVLSLWTVKGGKGVFVNQINLKT